MDPVTLGALAGAVVVLALAFVGAVTLLWVLRKTLALAKRVFFLGLALAVVAAVAVAALALAVAAT